MLLDLLLLDTTDFLDLTSSLFSSASFSHLMILCLKLNILSSFSSNHWLSARSSSSVYICLYSSIAAVSFNMSLNCSISSATADTFVNEYNISFIIPDFRSSLALIFSLSLFVFSCSNLYPFSVSFCDLLTSHGFTNFKWIFSKTHNSLRK